VHGGMKVLGISIITDACLPDALEPADITRIIATANRAEPNLTALVRGVLERLGPAASGSEVRKSAPRIHAATKGKKKK